MADPRPRVFGTETEYSVSPVNAAEAINCERVYLVNGSLVYKDAGHHLEHATAECLSVRDLIAQEKAGETIIERVSQERLKHLKDDSKRRNENENPEAQRTEEGYDTYRGDETGYPVLEQTPKMTRDAVLRLARLRLRKDQNDYSDHSYGYHESYQILRNAFPHVKESLLPHLPTREIITGAGAYDPHTDTFVISPRAKFLTCATGTSTQDNRPIINLRDEALGLKDDYYRLHLICGSANMSEVSTLLKIGTTRIVIMMAEDGFPGITEIPVPRDPLAAFKTIASDLTLQAKIETNQGMKRALDIQRALLSTAYRYFSNRIRPTEEENLILNTWGETLDLLERDPRLLDRRLDWVIKRTWMEAYVTARNSGGYKREKEEDPRHVKAQFDKRYSLIGEGSAFYLLQGKGIIERILTDDEVNWAVTNPPHDTRASFRGRLVEYATQTGGVTLVSADWTAVLMRTGGRDLAFILDDPHISEFDGFDITDLVGSMVEKGRNAVQIGKNGLTFPGEASPSKPPYADQNQEDYGVSRTC